MKDRTMIKIIISDIDGEVLEMETVVSSYYHPAGITPQQLAARVIDHVTDRFDIVEDLID